VRHYDLRWGSNVADIQVNLTDKHDRDVQSHDIAKSFRDKIQEIGSKYNANVKIVEVPPGPPVFSTIVAEIYGPDYETQINIADDIRTILKNTQDVVDVDWMVEADQIEYEFIVDKEKAMRYGVTPQQVVHSMNMAMSERPITNLYDEDASSPVGLILAFDEKEKSTVQDISQLKVRSNRGMMIPIVDLVQIKENVRAKSIFRKNQKRVVYVTSDMAGTLEIPVYAILGMSDKLKEIKLPAGYSLDELYIKQPDFEDNYTVKWDGEWQITLEVFRDLGMAFIGVIVIIYMLIVGWFQNFRAPIVMMVAIPLSLIGIILGHWMLDAFFTATSFIGMIALAGIMVRNSVLLIDFVN